MMNKPKGYDETTAAESGVNKRLPAGNYECVIINAKTAESKNGNEMLVLALDIAAGEYQGYFKDVYRRRCAYDASARYPNAAVYRQLTQGKSTAYFKGLIKAVEESNTGYRWNWDEKTLIGLKLGVMFGDESYVYNGETRHSARARFVCSVKSLKDKPVLEAAAGRGVTGGVGVASTAAAAAAGAGFLDIADDEDEDDLPF